MKNFQWTNDDQNQVAKYIAKDKMDPDDAAKKWIDANPDKVKASGCRAADRLTRGSDRSPVVPG